MHESGSLHSVHLNQGNRDCQQGFLNFKYVQVLQWVSCCCKCSHTHTHHAFTANLWKIMSSRLQWLGSKAGHCAKACLNHPTSSLSTEVARALLPAQGKPTGNKLQATKAACGKAALPRYVKARNQPRPVVIVIDGVHSWQGLTWSYAT